MCTYLEDYFVVLLLEHEEINQGLHNPGAGNKLRTCSVCEDGANENDDLMTSSSEREAQGEMGQRNTM